MDQKDKPTIKVIGPSRIRVQGFPHVRDDEYVVVVIGDEQRGVVMFVTMRDTVHVSVRLTRADLNGWVLASIQEEEGPLLQPGGWYQYQRSVWETVVEFPWTNLFNAR